MTTSGDIETLLAADAQAREAGRDPARSCIVQAPAGSGKTELLTQRVLALLAQVEAPESIVAITFTRKAAAEMRRRILDALADPTPPEAAASPHEATTRTLACAARANAEARGWALTDSPQRLRIQTIDGFCGALLRRSPLLSGAGGSPRVVDDANALYTEAAAEVLALRDGADETAEALRRVLLHLDHDVGRLSGMLSALLARRDAWRGLDLLAAPERADREALEAALARYVDTVMMSACTALGPDIRKRWYEGAVEAATNRPGDTALQAAVALGELPCTAGDAGHWRAFCDLLLTDKGQIRKRVNVSNGFPPKTEAKAAFEALLQELADTPGAESALQQLRALPTPAYDETQWAVLKDLLRLFSRAMAELQLRFATAGELDHTEVALRALQALGTPEAPSELLLKLDHRMQHLLVDEFQDTSDMQMELLRRLAAGWAPDDGRSLFLVGDPMQSIYRFRSANVGLFLQAWEQGIGGLGLERLRLCRNFRSQAGVVDWVNGCFPALMTAADLQSGRVAYAASVAAREAETGEAVRWHLHDDAASEAEAIAAICQDIPAEETAAVLLRSRNQAPAILAALQAAGLPAQAVDIDPLAGRPVVRDLEALARALLAPADRIAWLALLRAPVCGLDLSSLHAITQAAGEAPLWPMLDDAELQARLAPDQRQRLRRLHAALAPIIARVGRQPLVGVLEAAWLALGGPACLRDAGALQDAERYLGRLAELAGNAARPEPALLASATEKLFASSDPSADGRLQVMTMHKAKGLQFDHVILPGLSRGGGRDDKPALAQSSVISEDGELPVIAPIHAREQEDDPLFALVHKQIEGERDAAERTRLLYVAATRAVRRLHLCCQPKCDSAGEARPEGLLKDLWPAVAPTLAPLFRAHVAGEPAAATAEVEPPPLRRLPADWLPPPPPPGLPAPSSDVTPQTEQAPPLFDWAGERARATGTLYHEWVEWLAGRSPEEWPEAGHLRDFLRSRARGFGLDAEDAGTVAERVITAIDNTMRDHDGRWLLQAHPDGHAAELSIDRFSDGRLRNARIDRSFVDAEGTRWIIDYKTGSHEGGDLDAFVDSEIARYRGQLEAYARLFADEGRPLRLALYLPLLPAGRRLIPIDPA